MSEKLLSGTKTPNKQTNEQTNKLQSQEKFHRSQRLQMIDRLVIFFYTVRLFGRPISLLFTFYMTYAEGENDLLTKIYPFFWLFNQEWYVSVAVSIGE